MKKINLGLGAIGFLTSSFMMANSVVISERTVPVTVDIGTATLRLSSSGYSSPTVKVLVPGLADVTILNHRNEGEAAPCLATYDTMKPEDVIQGRPETLTVPTSITLSRNTFLNEETNSCDVILTENIRAEIRGFNFYHDRETAVENRHIDDCR